MLQAKAGKGPFRVHARLPKKPKGGTMFLIETQRFFEQQHQPKSDSKTSSQDGYMWTEILHQSDLITAKDNHLDYRLVPVQGVQNQFWQENYTCLTMNTEYRCWKSQKCVWQQNMHAMCSSVLAYIKKRIPICKKYYGFVHPVLVVLYLILVGSDVYNLYWRHFQKFFDTCLEVHAVLQGKLDLKCKAFWQAFSLFSWEKEILHVRHTYTWAPKF